MIMWHSRPRLCSSDNHSRGRQCHINTLARMRLLIVDPGDAFGGSLVASLAGAMEVVRAATFDELPAFVPDLVLLELTGTAVRSMSSARERQPELQCAFA